MFGSLVARLTTCPTFEYGIFHNDPDALQGHCVIMKSYYFRLRHFPKDDLFSGRNVLRSPVTIRPCKKWPRDEISQRSNVPSTFVTFVQTSKRSNVLGIARQTSSATIKLESKMEAITNLLQKIDLKLEQEMSNSGWPWGRSCSRPSWHSPPPSQQMSQQTGSN